MSFPNPTDSCYTIYSKSDCSHCVNAKLLLSHVSLAVYNCDTYLEESKEEFLEYIKKVAGKEHRSFPIIFKNAEYIGGYSELLKHLKEVYSLEE